VKEISIKPEKEQAGECWTESVTRMSSPESDEGDSQRSLSANSSKGGSKGAKGNSDVLVIDDFDDDGIEVIYDADYNGGN